MFGGERLTASDAAVRAGRLALGDAALVADLDAGLATLALAEAGRMVAERSIA